MQYSVYWRRVSCLPLAFFVFLSVSNTAEAEQGQPDRPDPSTLEPTQDTKSAAEQQLGRSPNGASSDTAVGSEAEQGEPSTGSAPEPRSPESMLSEADAALAAGEIGEAHALYLRLIEDFSDAPEADAARRSVKTIDATLSHQEAPTATEAKRKGSAGETSVTLDAYSARTSERLRLTWWEKLDFGVTAFLYGLQVGSWYSMSIETRDNGEAIGPVVAGASAYTLLSILYMSFGQPDRGDLPLFLAIASYIPATALLISKSNPGWHDARQKALAAGIAGTVAIPVAVVATRYLDLDPGDTQLTRDAGFWGMVLGVSGMLGFGVRERCMGGYCYEENPTGESVAMVGLLGLYGGLGLGALAAFNSEVSLERVRAATWGGYGGMILGALMGVAVSHSDSAPFKGASLGGLLGLALTLVTTSVIDEIPEGATMVDQSASSATPSLMSAVDAKGRSVVTWGLSWGLP